MRAVLFFACFLSALITVEARAKETLSGPFPAEVLRVVDGDTLDVRITVWLGQYLQTRVRLSGIDTPEKRGKCAEEKKLALEAQQALEKYIDTGTVVLKNVTTGKYAGRVLADVETVSGQPLSELLIQNGFARPYQGKKRMGWCG